MTEPTAGMEGGSSKGGGREEQRHGQREEATRPCEGNRKGWMERREGGREERQDQGKQDSENKYAHMLPGGKNMLNSRELGLHS